MSEFNPNGDDAFPDPSLQYGGKVVFNNEVPLEMKYSETDENDQIIVRIKIIVNDLSDESQGRIRIEMLCDTDLFLVYDSEYTYDDFEKLKESQGLTISFEQFPQLLIEILEQYVQNSDEYSVVFIHDSQSQGKLSFQQHLKFKTIIIFELDFQQAKDEFVKDSIQYRYNCAKSEVKSAQTELSDLYALLKIKNPSVLKKITTPKK